MMSISKHNMRLKSPRASMAFLLSQLGAHAAIIFGERLRPLNLKPQDAGILRILGSNPGATQQALSQMLGVFPSRSVSLLDELERQGLIERRSTAADRRVYQLHLTAAGVAALKAMRELESKLEDDIFAALGAEEKENLSSLLIRIISQQRITPSVHPALRLVGLHVSDRAHEEMSMQQTFTTKLVRDPKRNVTGIVVPPEVVSALSSCMRPAVRITLNGYTYRSTIASMGGRFVISLSAESRKAAGLEGNEELEVKLQLDAELHTTEIPADLMAALVRGKVLAKFKEAAPSRRKESVRQVQEAKAAATRARRIERIVTALQS